MLTEVACRAAKKAEKDYKLFDTGGLYLYVTKTGFRSWRWKYRLAGKEKRLVLGSYPEISLKRARELREDAARRLRAGEDPAAKANAPSSAPTFEALARRWHEMQTPLWKPKHAAAVLDSLVTDVFPAIGTVPVDQVRPSQVRELLTAVQARGATEAAHRIRGRISAIFGLAIAEELAEIDPAAAIGAVLKPIRKGRMPALTKLEEARAFLKAVEAAPAHPVTKLASRLLALTAVRPGIIRFTPRVAEFQDLDGEQPLWLVPAERMKLELEESEQSAFDHLVPLPPQAVDVIQVAQRLAGRGPWLFPGVRHAHRPISENAIGFLYKRMTEFRGRHVPHGWRSTFSSIMNERAAMSGRDGDADVIELMLAHKVAGVRGIYNRAAYMDRRRELTVEWADMLLKGFPPAEALLDGPRR
ncbi:MAG: tyrosine-type recombinase/integrase [Allosphingosinicella sp.]|uniref:tyrosine-type recombinase/integrase n=1 Tax=Allosphingosinicella sp. TaxID=2823234 RepID=UPI003957E6C0